MALEDFTIRGLHHHDIVRIMGALEDKAHMLRVIVDEDHFESGCAECEWNRMEAAHLDRIRGAVAGAKVVPPDSLVGNRTL